MAMTPAQPSVPTTPTPPPPDAHYDELSGVYGFFRRHQKKILYSAGLFTLLTFSITGAVTQVVNEWFTPPTPMPTIVVNGQRIELERRDYDYGSLLANNHGLAIPYGVLPPISAGDGARSELGDVLAVLRRAAITEGIEPSMIEVDRAIEALREMVKAPSAAKLASNMSFPSLAAYRDLMAEAMRIGMLVRLQTLAVDSTDARVLYQLKSDREKDTLRVATLDEKKLEETLKAAATLSDDDLQKWLDGKSDAEKSRIGIFDLPRAELRFGGILLAADQFDPEQWKDTFLKDFTVGDDQLKGYYEQEKDARFKLEGDKQWKPFDDAAVKAELTRLVQAEQVMNQILAKLREQQTEAMKAPNEELMRAQTEVGVAQNSIQELDQQAQVKQKELTAKEAELAQKPDDQALKDAVAQLRKDADKLKEDSFAAQAVVPSKKAAVTAAQDAMTAARSNFDFVGKFAELTKDKKGIVQKAMTGTKNADELKDLDALGLDLGKWPLSMQGTNLQGVGDLSFAPGRTSKAILGYQASALERQPLKPKDKIKPLAEGAYWTEQAKKQGEEKKKLMEEALLRLAKAKMPEKVTELEGKQQERVDQKAKEFEENLTKEIAEAEKVLARPGLGENAAAPWRRKLESSKARLGTLTQMREVFTAEVKKAIEQEIATEAKKHYKDVLDAAAAEAGFVVADVGPFPRDLQRQPRFDKRYDPTVVYLWSSQTSLKEGDATDVLQDMAQRRYHVAVCTKVEPVGDADLTRRDFESLRTGDGMYTFATQQAVGAYQRAFTREAIELRYELKRPAGEQRMDKSADDKKPVEDKKPADDKKPG